MIDKKIMVDDLRNCLISMNGLIEESLTTKKEYEIRNIITGISQNVGFATSTFNHLVEAIELQDSSEDRKIGFGSDDL